MYPPTYPPPAPQPDLYPIPQRKPPARWLRWALLPAVVLPSVLSVLLTPVNVSPAKLLADVRAGEVQQLSLTCGEDDDGLSFSVGSTVSYVDALCWTDGTLLYRTNLGALRADMRVQSGSRVDVVDTVRATATAAGQPEPVMVQDVLPGWSALMTSFGLVSLLAFVTAIVLLVRGPQPRFMTKWGVFWTLGMPLNAGLFWWLFYEAPWSVQARAMPEPAGHAVRHTFDGRTRRGGGQMFLWLLLASFVCSVLVTAVQSTLSAALEPSGDAGIWAGQQASGSSTTDLGADICTYFPEDC